MANKRESKRHKDARMWLTPRNAVETGSAGATTGQQPREAKASPGMRTQASIMRYAQKNHKLTWLMDTDTQDIEGLALGWTEKRLLEHSADGDGETQLPPNLYTPHPSMYDDTQPPVETQSAEEPSPAPNESAPEAPHRTTPAPHLRQKSMYTNILKRDTTRLSRHRRVKRAQKTRNDNSRRKHKHPPKY